MKTQILHLNLWQLELELNSASAPCLLLPWRRTFNKKNFHFPKAEFVCMNSFFHIFQFILRLRAKFSLSISDNLKENSILQLLLFFFYSEDGLLIRKLLILWNLNSSAWIKFSFFFSFFCRSNPNSGSQFLTVSKKIQFCISSFFCSTLRMNFS